MPLRGDVHVHPVDVDIAAELRAFVIGGTRRAHLDDDATTGERKAASLLQHPHGSSDGVRRRMTRWTARRSAGMLSVWLDRGG
jgi:hypothetical protein